MEARYGHGHIAGKDHEYSLRLFAAIERVKREACSDKPTRSDLLVFSVFFHLVKNIVLFLVH